MFPGADWCESDQALLEDMIWLNQSAAEAEESMGLPASVLLRKAIVFLGVPASGVFEARGRYSEPLQDLAESLLS